MSLLFVFSACTETTISTPPLYMRGSMEGYAALYSSDTIARSNGGIRISLDGTQRSTITDERGHWKIDGLTTRSYDLRFERDSFPYIRVFDYPFVGGGSAFVPDQVLRQGPQERLQLLAVFGPNLNGSARLFNQSIVSPLDIIIAVDSDSIRLAATPEYAPLVARVSDPGHPLDEDTLGFGLQGDTTLYSIFPVASTEHPVYARVAISNRRRDQTSFYDPLVRRTIVTGFGVYSNIMRVKLP